MRSSRTINSLQTHEENSVYAEKYITFLGIYQPACIALRDGGKHNTRLVRRKAEPRPPSQGIKLNGIFKLQKYPEGLNLWNKTKVKGKLYYRHLCRLLCVNQGTNDDILPKAPADCRCTEHWNNSRTAQNWTLESSKALIFSSSFSFNSTDLCGKRKFWRFGFARCMNSSQWRRPGMGHLL